MKALDRPAQTVVTMGSSMGATAALKFGLMLRVKGIVAISPHIDLDICAERQGRWRHVAVDLPDGDPLAPHNYELHAAGSPADRGLRRHRLAAAVVRPGLPRRRRRLRRAGRAPVRGLARCGWDGDPRRAAARRPHQRPCHPSAAPRRREPAPRRPADRRRTIPARSHLPRSQLAPTGAGEISAARPVGSCAVRLRGRDPRRRTTAD